MRGERAQDLISPVVDNSDLIMAMLIEPATRNWDKRKMLERLKSFRKISDEDFEKALLNLARDEWVMVDPASDTVHRIGPGYGSSRNGTWPAALAAAKLIANPDPVPRT